MRPRHRVGEARVDAAHELFGRRHEIEVRGIRLVVLEHRELGVVARADPLVPVAAPDLVDPLESADDEALQVELRGDSHEELHVERAVVRLERVGCRAADERVERRRFDLEKAVLVEDGASGADDLRAGAEHVGDVGARDEIDVPLAVARLDVLQAVPLLGERTERFRQEAERLRLDRQLARLRYGERPLHLDEVADVDVVEPCVVVAERRLAHEELNLPRPISEAREPQPADVTHADHAPADVPDGVPFDRRDALFHVLPVDESFVRAFAQRPQVDRPAAREARSRVVRERILSTPANALRLAAPDLDDRVFGRVGRVSVRVGHLRHPRDRIGHGRLCYSVSASSATPPFRIVPPAAASRYASMNPSRSPSRTASTLLAENAVRVSLTRR